MESDTRERLLNAAQRLYAVKGSRGTTTRAVAAEAGVNELTLFRHFGSKKGLMEAMVRRLADDPVVERTLGGAVSGDLEQDLLYIARNITLAMEEATPLLRMFLAEISLHPENAALAATGPMARLQRLARFFQERMDAGQIRQGNPYLMAHAFAGMFMARAMARPMFEQLIQVPEDEVIRAFVHLFAHGAAFSEEKPDAEA